MSRFFDRQQDQLPVALVGGFQVHDVRQREYERQASGRWPLLSVIDDHMWSRHVQRNAMRRSADPLGAFVEVDEPEPEPRQGGRLAAWRQGSRR